MYPDDEVNDFTAATPRDPHKGHLLSRCG